jgi:acid phosphatase (class A)
MRIGIALGIAVVISTYAASVLAAPSFLTPEQYDPARLLPPPPADGTAATKAELAELHRIQATRTDTQYARAKRDGKTEDATIFAEVVPGFDLAKLTATAKLFADVRAEEKEAVTVAKAFFARTRPYVADQSLHGCENNVKAPKTSYPSGHATMGYSMAVILAALVPEKSQAVLARAAEYAENRLVCGVHYRGDIAAGEALGATVAIELMNNPAFKAEFEAARTELRGAQMAAH